MQHGMVQKYMGELEQHFGIKVCTLYVRVPFATARRRVMERLAREPWRKQYHEGDNTFLRKTYKYYEDRSGEWNHVIVNDGPISESVKELLRIVGSRSRC